MKCNDIPAYYSPLYKVIDSLIKTYDKSIIDYNKFKKTIHNKTEESGVSKYLLDMMDKRM